MRYRNDLSAAYVRELFSYDPETGVFRWLTPKAQRIKVGDVAGSISRSGHRYIEIDGHAYLAHRLAWLHYHGVWPEGRLDHEDRNGDNNRIKNLRPATQAQNMGNRSKGRNNRSGYKGVSFWTQDGREGWQAKIMVGKKQRHLGLFSTRELAFEAYMKAAKEAWGEFATEG
ncbi:hypothetical protein ADL19_14780 [Streptomyces purpurogeneiscleroticus]|nr:hypothetical protein ADL19_14780 [Streptomyces purpurogeneiscleroticus]